VLIAA